MGEKIEGALQNISLRAMAALIAVLLSVIGFFLTGIFIQNNRMIAKVEAMNDWRIKHDSEASLYIGMIKDYEPRIKAIEDGNHPSTADRYTRNEAHSDLLESENKVKEYVDEYFVRK